MGGGRSLGDLSCIALAGSELKCVLNPTATMQMSTHSGMSAGLLLGMEGSKIHKGTTYF